jgi:tryptophanyl-tRNA synthetase
MSKKRLLSGIQPSGIIHLGNYFGAIKQFVDLQKDYDTSIFIADFHAITTIQDGKQLKQNILDVVMDYLACGLDPEKICLFKQSDIPEVAELTWYFNCITSMPFLERATAYKDAHMKAKEINVGLFDYPVLMAADILIQDSDIVPVGADQKQHIEYARDIALKFNNIYGETFKLPEGLILKEVSIVPGLDGRKMSKSYKNTIPLFGTDEEIKKKVMSIVTDSKRPEDKKNPDECNIYKIHKLFLNREDLIKLRKRYEDGGLSYKESKDMLYSEIISFISPMREKRKYYENNLDEVRKILEDGKIKVRKIIEDKMKIVRDKVGTNI